MIARRSLLRAMIAAPFIVKASSLMPVRSFALEEYPFREISLGWLVISGVDRYGCPMTEKFRYQAGGWHTTTINWQCVDNIALVDGSFSAAEPSLDRVDSGYDL